MLNITYKTAPSEIITLEEIAILFDSISKKHETALVSLSLFPNFNDIRQRFLEITSIQRNEELSELLAKISERKQELKIKIWQELGKLNSNKKLIEKSEMRANELEQITYEQEQIINAYEMSLKSLTEKEKKIMNGKYQRIGKTFHLHFKKVLRNQLESLKDALLEISKRHNNCFQELENDLTDLIRRTTITFPIKFSENISQEIQAEKAKEDLLNIELPDINNNFEQPTCPVIKDYYLYEPEKGNLDDDLIFLLLEQSEYNDRDGTVNGLFIPTKDDN